MKKRRFSLGFLLIAYTVLSLLIGVGVFFGLRQGGLYVLENCIYTKEGIIEQEKQLFSEYIEYLNDNSGSYSSRDDALAWLNGRKYIMLSVYNGGSPFGGSDSGAMLVSSDNDSPAMYELLQREYADYWYTCPVMTGNDYKRSKLVRILYYPWYDARTYIQYGAIGFGCAAFVLTLLLFIRGKTKYIAYLSRQLNIMEGGELNVPMQLKGSDDLTSLAANMDRMRLSFIERLQHEADMDRSSRELMTAMSHDLRTPLTALMGYLEIVDSGTVADADKQREYISSALKRAKQLKGMTDELFEYFLVYSTQDTQPEMEEMDAMTVFCQLWEESSFALESEGFETNLVTGNESSTVSINAQLMHRVFDNMISNIRKYADKGAQVTADMRLNGSVFAITVTNKVGHINKAESSGIGLMSCQKVLATHGGTFTAETKDGNFVCKVTLPVKPLLAEAKNEVSA